MDSTDKNKDLIRKYLSDSYTPAEWEEIREFMLTQESRQLFEEVLDEQGRSLDAELDIEKPALKQRLKLFYTKLQEEEHQAVQSLNQHKITSFLNRRNLFQYAAIWIVLMFGAGMYAIYQYQQTPPQELQVAMRELVNPKGQRSRILLPDSSAVFLGADSKLSFPEKFAGDVREVSLEGSAFFEVTKNPKKPFIIHTGTVQTKVLGTSFKVEAFEGRPVTVAVATGKVRVDDFLKAGTKALAMLTPGQMLSYDHGAPVTSSTNIAELQDWKFAKLNFHSQSLQEITTELERWYDVRIQYENQAKAREKISVTLQVDMPLQKIMKVLAATGHFDFTISGKQIRIN